VPTHHREELGKYQRAHAGVVAVVAAEQGVERLALPKQVLRVAAGLPSLYTFFTVTPTLKPASFRSWFPKASV
jgi:hypothetical protein